MAGLLKTARSFNELGELMKNARVHIRVKAGFVLQGRKPAEIDEVVEVSRSLASELVASGKAEICDAPKASPPATESEPPKSKAKS